MARKINAHLQGTERKLWHGHPVWFSDGNPIAGYSVVKNGIQLLFWSGQSFEEKQLQPVGKHMAAEVRYTQADHINLDDLAHWLAKSQAVQWDCKHIVKHKGVIERLQ